MPDSVQWLLTKRMCILSMLFTYHSSSTEQGHYSSAALQDLALRLCMQYHRLKERFQSEIAGTQPLASSAQVKAIAKELQDTRGEELPCFLSFDFFKMKTAKVWT
jgi:hypothetical protein